MDGKQVLIGLLVLIAILAIAYFGYQYWNEHHNKPGAPYSSGGCPCGCGAHCACSPSCRCKRGPCARA